jgi:hydroxypyruvate isomerase
LRDLEYTGVIRLEGWAKHDPDQAIDAFTAAFEP